MKSGCLDKDSRDFASAAQEVIGPFDIDPVEANGNKGLSHRDGGCQTEQWKIGDAACRAEEEREVESFASRRVPVPALPASSGSLSIGRDAGPLRGIDERSEIVVGRVDDREVADIEDHCQ